jgi:hypothetical protein
VQGFVRIAIAAQPPREKGQVLIIVQGPVFVFLLI